MIKFFRRWAVAEELALTKQLTAKDATDRFAGMFEARRNEARALLSGIAPVLVCSIIFAPYREANWVGKALLNVTFGWCVVVLVATLFFVVRALIRIGKR